VEGSERIEGPREIGEEEEERDDGQTFRRTGTHSGVEGPGAVGREGLHPDRPTEGLTDREDRGTNESRRAPGLLLAKLSFSISETGTGAGGGGGRSAAPSR
jgi:hypothetical protein